MSLAPWRNRESLDAGAGGCRDMAGQMLGQLKRWASFLHAALLRHIWEKFQNSTAQRVGQLLNILIQPSHATVASPSMTGPRSDSRKIRT